MHRNTFINAPQLLDEQLRLRTAAVAKLDAPLFVAGQLSGTEGYCEAIRSGLHVAMGVAALLAKADVPNLPRETAFVPAADVLKTATTIPSEPLSLA